jgi:hypothetical protein
VPFTFRMGAQLNKSCQIDANLLHFLFLHNNLQKFRMRKSTRQQAADNQQSSESGIRSLTEG